MSQRWIRSLSTVMLALGLLWSAPVDAKRIPTRVVRINSTPPGATVHLDDPNAPPLGATPIRHVRVPKGEHTFIFKLDGYDDARVTVDVKRHWTRVNATLEQSAILELTAGDQPSFGATLTIDGLESGRVPQRLSLSPGRHQVIVTRDNYQPMKAWVELERGKTVTLPVELGPATSGSVLVSADVADATVWLNGEERGAAPAVLEGVPVGSHELELRAANRQPYRITIEVKPGEQTTVAARMKFGTGALRVTANVPGATVQLDGEVIGRVPADKTGLTVGQHLLEVSAPGYLPLQETITIEGGMRRLLGVHLEPGGLGSAGPSITVTTSTPGARVTVNSRELGRAPLTVPVEAGEHQVELSAPEYQPYRSRCVVSEEEACTRHAKLFRTPHRLALTSAVGGAQVFIGGELAGTLPYDGGIPAGKQVVEVRADGHDAWRQEIEPGEEPVVLEATLKRTGEKPPTPSVLLHSARTVPQGLFTLDMSAGWVHLAEVAVDYGALPYLDAGVAVRTFGRLTEVEGRARFSWQPIDYLVVAARLRVGGGGGPRGVNTAFVLAEGLTSFVWDPHLAVTLTTAIDVYSDEYPYAETNADVPAAASGRQNTIALRIGAGLDVALIAGWSLWANIEWTGPQTRRLLGDLFGAENEAVQTQFRLGATVAF